MALVREKETEGSHTLSEIRGRLNAGSVARRDAEEPDSCSDGVDFEAKGPNAAKGTGTTGRME